MQLYRISMICVVVLAASHAHASWLTPMVHKAVSAAGAVAMGFDTALASETIARRSADCDSDMSRKYYASSGIMCTICTHLWGLRNPKCFWMPYVITHGISSCYLGINACNMHRYTYNVSRAHGKYENYATYAARQAFDQESHRNKYAGIMDAVNAGITALTYVAKKCVMKR